eukprot:COSAG04_NODE_257_length_18753_cov_7.516857_2_plen_119_part_00
MPGFIGKDLQGRKCAMKTYGAMYAEVRAEGGEKLQLRPGKTIELSCNSSVPLPSAPAPMPSAWRFDEQAGMWQQTRNVVTVDGVPLELTTAEDSGTPFSEVPAPSEPDADWDGNIMES